MSSPKSAFECIKQELDRMDEDINFKEVWIPEMISAHIADLDGRTFFVRHPDSLQPINNMPSSAVMAMHNEWQGVPSDKRLCDFLEDNNDPHDNHETYYCYLWSAMMLEYPHRYDAESIAEFRQQCTD